MSDKTRKIIGTLSIMFIIGLYVVKGLPSFAGKSVSDILPILFTSITVTGVKVGIICGVIVIGKKIVKKLNSSVEIKHDDGDDFEKENNNVTIKEKKKEQEKTIENRKIVNTEYEILDKPKILTKRK